MDWTLRPLDHFWTIFWTIFLAVFGPFFRGEADHYYLGRGGMQSISTQHSVVTEEGVEDELLVPREDWAVDVVVNAID